MIVFVLGICIILLEILSVTLQWPATYLWPLSLTCLFGWILYPKKCIEIGVATVIGLVLLQYLSVTEMLSILFGHVVLLLFIGSCFSYLMVKHKVHEVISTNTLATLQPKSLSSLMIVVMGIAAFLSMWISNTSAVVMLIPIVAAIAQQTKLSSESILIIGAYGATIGGMLTPIGTPSNLVAVDYAERFFGIKVGFVDWFLYALPFVAVMLFILVGYIVLVYRQSVQVSISHIDVMPQQKRIIKLIAGCILLWATKTLPFGGWQAIVGDSITEEIIGLGVLILAYFSYCHKNRRLFTFSDLSKVSYSGIVMVMTGLCIAQAVKTSGVVEILSAHVSTLEGISSVSWLLMIASVVSALTELCSNTAVTALSLTLTDMMMSTSSLDPLSCIFIVTLSANSAFILPTATPPNALVLGTGKVSLSKMMGFGAVLSMISLLILRILYF